MQFLSSLRDSFRLSNLPHGLRRGLHSFAPSGLLPFSLSRFVLAVAAFAHDSRLRTHDYY